MIITLEPELEVVLKEVARHKGATPEALALELLRERIHEMAALIPRDEWERGLLELAINCGVTLPNEALSREELYE